MPIVTFLLSGLTLILYLLAGPTPEAFIYNRLAIEQGELWRLVTGHSAHIDLAHLIWNGLGLLAFGAFLEHLDRAALIATLIVSAIIIDALLWLAMPDLVFFAGLSGILHALVGSGSVLAWARSGQFIYIAVLLATLVKVVSDLILEQSLIMDLAWPVVSECHIVGLFSGLLVSSAFYQKQRRVRKAKRP